MSSQHPGLQLYQKYHFLHGYFSSILTQNFRAPSSKKQQQFLVNFSDALQVLLFSFSEKNQIIQSNYFIQSCLYDLCHYFFFFHKKDANLSFSLLCELFRKLHTRIMSPVPVIWIFPSRKFVVEAILDKATKLSWGFGLSTYWKVNTSVFLQIIIVIALYLTSAKLQTNDEFNYKSHSL